MDMPVTDAAEELLRTYTESGGINYLDAAAMLPSRPAIELACVDLMSLMFPGFHGEALVDSSDLPDVTRSRIKSLHIRMKPEISKSFNDLDRDAADQKAEDVLNWFMSQLGKLRQVLWTDVDAAYEGDPAATSYEEVIVSYPAVEAIAIQRMAHLLYEKEVPLIPRLMTEWAHTRTGIDIHPGAKIGSHFFIDHGTGVVIGETCDIGDHVKIYQGVTLGALSFATDADGQLIRGTKRHPTIEDRVVIYANATILGGRTTVGHDSVIGSSVWVTSSVTPHSTVVLEKPKLRIRSGQGDELMHDSNYQI